MNITRTLYIIFSYPQRIRHRYGYGVQSPSDYELVRDVLFESLHYYAYEDLNLKSKDERQLWRLKNRFGSNLVVLSDKTQDEYECIASSASNDTMLVIENLDNKNAALWDKVLQDPRATVTFDLATRGLVSFNSKRIKQNYIL